MGKIIQIEEHRYELPEMPKKPVTFIGIYGREITIPVDELIINNGQKRENSYWKRDYVPKFFYDYIPGVTQLDAEHTLYNGTELVSLSKEDTLILEYYYEREMYRRRNGVWFKNDDEYVYLTGHNYFFLMWMLLYGVSAKLVASWRESGYPYAEYMEYQRDIFYLIDLVCNDPDKLGLYIAKAKKTGVTQLFASYYLNKATMTRDAQMGIMSKGTDASDTNMLFIMKGYDGLPPIFQPSIKERADKEGKLFFGETALRNVRTKKGKERRKELLNAKPLDTKIYAAKTKQAGFDAPVMQDIWFDEFPKYWSENKQEPEVVFNRNQEAVKIQDIFNGRIWITSYPPEVDDIGFTQGRKIYFNSKLKTVKEGRRRTSSGLICYYVSALNSYRSTFNKYGKPDQQEAKRKNREARDEVKSDKKAYQAKIRQYSETERECWSSSGAGSTFDNVRIGELHFDLTEEMKYTRFYTEGRLVWDNAIWEAGAQNRRPVGQFTSVSYVPLTEQQIDDGTEGRLRIFVPPYKDDICASLRRGRDEYGNLMPPPILRNYGAVDPTELAEGTEVNQGSKNANYTLNFPDPVMDSQRRKISSGVIMSEYFYRPDNPEEYYQDVVKEILFFDKYVIVEANKAWVATRLIRDGLGRFMLIRNKETGVIEPWTQKHEIDKNYSLIRTTEEDKTAIVIAISKILVKPALGEVDYAKEGIKSDRLLMQLMDFDPKDTKKFDLVMGYGWALICGDVLSVIPMYQENEIYSAANVQAAWGALVKAG